MKRKILLFAAALLLCVSCNEINDPRNHDVPETVHVAWLLSVEMDKLPAGTDWYTISIIDTIKQERLFEVIDTTVNLPELKQIPGALVIRPNRIAAIGWGKKGDIENDYIYMPVPDVPIIHRDETGEIIYTETPIKIAFDTLGIAGKFHFRYD